MRDKSVLPRDVVSRQQVLRILQARMPEMLPQDIEPFADKMCGGSTSLTFDDLVFNVFQELPVPYVAWRKRGGRG